MDDLIPHILEALEKVMAPDGRSAAAMASDLRMSDGEVFFILTVDHKMGGTMEPLRRQAEEAVRGVPGVTNVQAVLTAERAASPAPDPHGMAKNPPLTLPFRHVIAVASGKGGVGKSTVAYNLAAHLAAAGMEIGLLDADIYGPSIPILSGLTGQKPVTNENKKIVPLEAHGMKIMSMGFLVDAEKPMIWRGPMVQTAFYQMLRDVAWRSGGGQSDVLVIDMPPGTGDVQLTLAQKVPVTGAVIVSTPQDLALADARKAIAMFEKTGIKILGLIENMSYYCCPKCGERDDVFGHGKAALEAEKQNVPYLGDLPLSTEIQQAGVDSRLIDEKHFAPIVSRIAASLI